MKKLQIVILVFIAVAIAVEDGGELRSYGTIGGKLADLDKLIKKLAHPGVELRFS